MWHRQLRAQDAGGSQDALYRVGDHKKYATPFACIRLRVFGRWWTPAFARGGIVMAIGVSVVVCALYWAGSSWGGNG